MSVAFICSAYLWLDAKVKGWGVGSAHLDRPSKVALFFNTRKTAPFMLGFLQVGAHHEKTVVSNSRAG